MNRSRERKIAGEDRTPEALNHHTWVNGWGGSSIRETFRHDGGCEAQGLLLVRNGEVFAPKLQRVPHLPLASENCVNYIKFHKWHGSKVGELHVRSDLLGARLAHRVDERQGLSAGETFWHWFLADKNYCFAIQ